MRSNVLLQEALQKAEMDLAAQARSSAQRLPELYDNRYLLLR